MTNKAITAACCVIGDEILSGKTKDSNSHYLATTLFNIGIELKTIQVVPDHVDDITKSVQELSRKFDLVFTSGGIGPTHDDITYASVASAFGLEMKRDDATYNYIKKQMEKRNQKVTEYHARMATFPSPAQLLKERKDLPIPIVCVNNNVYILPGIPSLFKVLLDSLVPRLEKLSGSKFYRHEIATKQPETTIAHTLTEIQKQADEHGIKIGSYPVWGKHSEGIRVVVTISGKDETQVNKYSQQVIKSIEGWPKSRL